MVIAPVFAALESLLVAPNESVLRTILVEQQRTSVRGENVGRIRGQMIERPD
jgi:hypothetical protein